MFSRIRMCMLALLWAPLLAKPQSTEIDSLQQLYAGASHDTTRARLILRIGSAYFYSNMDSAWAWWEKALVLGEALAQDPDSTIREKGQRAIMGSSNNMAVVAQYRGMHPLALRNYQRCIRISLALHDRRGLLNSLNNIGLIKKEQDKFQEALEHFQLAYRLAKTTDDAHLLATTLNNIGTAHIKLQHDEIALRYFRKSLRYSIASNDRVQEVDNLINIGATMIELAKPDSGLRVLREADSIALEIEYALGRPEILMGLARAHQDLGDLPTALDYARQALALSTELDMTEVTVEALEILSGLEQALGQYEAAHTALLRYIQLKDSLFTAEKTVEFGQLEASFAYERDEYEKALAAERDAAKVKARHMAQYLTAFASLCGFVLLVLVAMRWVRGKWLRRAFVFAALLFFFEFVLVLLDSFIDGMTGGLPFPKLFANIVLAAAIAPMNTLLEGWMMRSPARAKVSG